MEYMHAKNAALFKAFCDETRLKILELLKYGEKCACVLQEDVGSKQPNLSYHMKILLESGIVESRQDGVRTFYKISNQGRLNALSQLEYYSSIISVEECKQDEQ